MPRRLAVAAALVVVIGGLAVGFVSTWTRPPAAAPSGDAEAEQLPSPRVDGGIALEMALGSRRSIRSFSAQPLTREEIGQLLWAAQGVTGPEGQRTAPSAGRTYPLEVDVVTADGLARYVPEGHRLIGRGSDDLRPALQGAAGGQEAVGTAPLVIVISGVVSRTEPRYGDRAERYVAIEAGHAAQNVLLEAVSLGLGAVPVGAFDDAAVRQVLGLADGEAPLYLLPVGHPG